MRGCRMPAATAYFTAVGGMTARSRRYSALRGNSHQRPEEGALLRRITWLAAAALAYARPEAKWAKARGLLAQEAREMSSFFGMRDESERLPAWP